VSTSTWHPIVVTAGYITVFAVLFLLLGLLQLGLWVALNGWVHTIDRMKALHRRRLAVVRRATSPAPQAFPASATSGHFVARPDKRRRPPCKGGRHQASPRIIPESEPL
jgi:hypothetical protein